MTANVTIRKGASVIVCLVDEFGEISINDGLTRVWNSLIEFGWRDQIVDGHVYGGEAGDEGGRLEDGAGN